MGLADLGVVLVKVVAVFGILLLAAAYMTWVERKVLGHIQVRYGPMRVGWHGLLQPVADGLKLFFKEDIIPHQADRLIYMAAPAMALIPALAAFAVVPFGDAVQIFGRRVDLYLADVNVGILYILALSSLGVYGIVLAGWSSNSKYPLLGGLRSGAQMVSYELTLTLSLVGVVMIARSLSLVEVVNAQREVGVPFILLQPLGFLLFFVCGVAETNRAPFDLPEAETELTAGFHTEYSSMKFAMFFLAEYINMITLSAVATTFFLGGWQGPSFRIFLGGWWVPFPPPVVWFSLKVFALLFVFVWLRGTLPRFRYDQLMAFGWKVLLPLALFNVAATGGILALMGD